MVRAQSQKLEADANRSNSVTCLLVLALLGPGSQSTANEHLWGMVTVVAQLMCYIGVILCRQSCIQVIHVQNVWLDAAGKMTTRGEQVLWQQQYVNCCAELGQWDVINEYARGTENYAAYMDVAWKCSDWQGLKDWVLPKGAVEDTPRVSMVKAFVLLQDADVTQANLHTENAITQTLHR